ncbi:MAG: sulfurtransferase TusA family protein [Magnetococcales bacterium]|nr:sulfurtransferase TusA family protein [Magnetococcales bacterium]
MTDALTTQSAPSSPDHELDARHMLCPLPLIRASSAIGRLSAGQVLAIRATDPGLRRDLPAWCAVNGHTLIDIIQNGPELVGYIQKEA